MHFSAHILHANYAPLSKWTVKVPNRPYWRLHWNDQPGAEIYHEDDTIELNPKTLILIAPHTEYTVGFEAPLNHLFMHYQLAQTFQHAQPGVYAIPVTRNVAASLHETQKILHEPSDTRKATLTCTWLIQAASLQLPEDVWATPNPDPRITVIMSVMDQNLQHPLSNDQLASQVHMAPTSFVRLFSKEVGMSPQAYYLQRRLEHASMMLEFGDDSLESIADSCGFCDRNYFSATYKKHTGMPPAMFRKLSRT